MDVSVQRLENKINTLLNGFSRQKYQQKFDSRKNAEHLYEFTRNK